MIYRSDGLLCDATSLVENDFDMIGRADGHTVILLKSQRTSQNCSNVEGEMVKV